MSPALQHPPSTQPNPTCPHMQLPVYVPNEEEREDPKLFASNVRKYMVSLKVAARACTCARVAVVCVVG